MVMRVDTYIKNEICVKLVKFDIWTQNDELGRCA
jgi:hypothetical protein